MLNRHRAIFIVTMALLGLGLLGLISLAASARTSEATPAERGPSVSDDTLRIVRQPGNLLLTVSNMIDQRTEQLLFRATVVEITTKTLRIQRTGHEPDVAFMAVLDNFPYPKVGDEVLVAKVGAGWMVVGSVLRSGLEENYLTIETELRILPPEGRIVWGSDGKNFIDEDIIHIEVGPGGVGFLEIQNGTSPKARFLGQADTDFSRAIVLADGDVPFPDERRQAAMRVNASNVAGLAGDEATFAELTARRENPLAGMPLEPNNFLGGQYTVKADGLHIWQVDEGVTALRLERAGNAFRIFGVLVTEITAQTIASNTIEATSTFIEVDTEGAAVSDDIDNIFAPGGGSPRDGQRLTITPADDTRTVRVTEVGNIELLMTSTFSMNQIEESVSLIYRVSLGKWVETARATNF